MRHYIRASVSRKIRAAIAIGLIVTLAQFAWADTHAWTGLDGRGAWWDYGNNWNLLAQPHVGDNVYINWDSGSDYIVSYWNTLYPTGNLTYLEVDQSGGGTCRLDIANSGQWLGVVNEDVGWNNRGAVRQTTSTHSVSNNLYIGHNVGSNGTYSLSGGTLSVGWMEVLGSSGSGTFLQSGGTHTVASSLVLGWMPNSRGYYSLSGGTITSNYTVIGDDASAIGTFTQSTGLHRANGELYLAAYNSTSAGWYYLNGGTLSVASTSYVGERGHGTMLQTGGVAQIGTLNLADGASATGYYGISNSASISMGGDLIVGDLGVGTFVQQNSSNVEMVYPHQVILGNGVGSRGTYLMQSSGSLIDYTTIVGNGGIGSFSQSAGSHSTFILSVGVNAAGAYQLSGSSSSLSVRYNETIGYSSAGSFLQTGGTHTIREVLTIGSGGSARGTYTLNGGTLAVSAIDTLGYETIGYDGAGTFIQGGGFHQIDSSLGTDDSLILGYNATGTGTYSMTNGSLTMNKSLIVGARGAGTFIQNGGTHTLTGGAIYLGWGPNSRGTYSLGGGTFINSGWDRIGQTGAGTFIQTGGFHAAAGMQLGLTGSLVDNTGFYSISAGTLSLAGSLSMYTGMTTFNQTGGVVSVGDMLLISERSNAYATYTLSSTGVLNASAESVGYAGHGTFTQSGGSHTVPNELQIGSPDYTGSGTFTLGGGTLSAGSIDLVVNGTFNQTGGTLSPTTFNHNGGTIAGAMVNSGTLIHNSGSFTGSLNNYGTVVLNADLSIGGHLENYAVVPALNIPSARTLTVSGYVHNDGIMSLNGGTFVANNLQYIGYSGNGTFQHNSGAHNGWIICIGDNGHTGRYTLTSGTLATSEGQVVGGDGGTGLGYGTFTQNGGTNNVGYSLLIGRTAGSTGYYALNSGTLTVASAAYAEFVGVYGTGTFVQTGGLNTVNTNLWIGFSDSYAGGSGTFLLNGGTVSAVAEVLGTGTGVFTQNAGYNYTGSLTINSGSTFNMAGGTFITNGAIPTISNSGVATFGGNQRWAVGTTFRNYGTAAFNSDAGGGFLLPTIEARSATLSFNTSQHLGVLSIFNGAKATIASGAAPHKLVRTNQLSIEGGITPLGRLDLTNNSVIVDYVSASPFATIRSQVISARTGGTWTGFGITSSLANASTYSVACAEAYNIFGTFPAVWGGETIDPTTVLLKYTYYGDANLDGQVDISDLGKLATAWQTSGWWVNGDFDYSGFVDISDLGKLATNWQAGVGSPLGPSLDQALVSLGFGGANVPEPIEPALSVLAILASWAWPLKRLCRRNGLRTRI